MSQPIVKSGKFVAGKDLQCGANVVVNVAEEMVVGDRVVLPDNSYFEGRRVEIGNDFYGASWGHPTGTGWGPSDGSYEWRLDPKKWGNPPPLPTTVPFGRWLEVGRGRIDGEDAILKVGSRCTFHDNRIDLARSVTIGDDVGLSPEVVIYTHYYWQSPLDGFPMRYRSVYIHSGVIVGFRSTILPGTVIDGDAVVGAGSVVSGNLRRAGVYAGCPAKRIRWVEPLPETEAKVVARYLMEEYYQSRKYYWPDGGINYCHDWPVVKLGEFSCNLKDRTWNGQENGASDDLRWFLFSHGIRIYTERPFRRLPRRA